MHTIHKYTQTHTHSAGFSAHWGLALGADIHASDHTRTHTLTHSPRSSAHWFLALGADIHSSDHLLKVCRPQYFGLPVKKYNFEH